VPPKFSWDRSAQKQKPPEEDDQRDQHRGEQCGSRPGVSLFSRRGVVHAAPPTPWRCEGVERTFDKTRARRLACRVMKVFKKRNLADIVIFAGMAVNAVVILLILYFYVI
jgi:hypothetical protein